MILDTLSAHRTPGVRQRVEAAGCTLLFLPPDTAYLGDQDF